MIREAKASDILAITDLGVEALEIDAYNLTVDRTKVYQAAKEAVGKKQHFAWVSEEKGIIKGALIAMVHDSELYHCRQAVIYMWFCKKRGDGVRLMREFIRWVKEHPAVRQVVYVTERRGDKRIGEIVRRMGFEAVAMYVMTR